MTDITGSVEISSQLAGEPEKFFESVRQQVDLFRFAEPDKATHLIRQVLGKLPQNGSSGHRQGEYFLLAGDLFTQVGEYDAALEVLESAIRILEQDEQEDFLVEAQLLAGRAHLYLASYVNALQFTLKGLEVNRKLDDRKQEGRLLNNLGAIYVQRQEFTRALPYLLRSLKDADETQDAQSQASAQEKICLVYVGLNNPELALKAGMMGLSISRENQARLEEAQALNSLGRAYHLMKEYPRALECYAGSLLISNEISLRFEEARSLIYQAAVYVDQDLPEQALGPLERALEIAEKTNARGQQVDIHQALSSAYRQANQFQPALAHYESFHEIKENVYSDETETRLKNLEVKYQVEEARREAEVEQEKNVQLQTEIEERVHAQRSLQEANGQLQREIVIKEQLISDLNAFTRMVAHDLKTPLQTIAIITHLLQHEVDRLDDNGKALDLLNQLQQTDQKSNAIIHELLTLASLRSQEIELQELDMAEVIGEVYKRISFIIDESHAEVSGPSVWPLVYGHAPWIEEVWANYLTNAIKYGGFPPLVQIGAMPDEPGYVKFWVQDNGDGVKPEDQPKLFQDFSRVGTQLRVEGHGLGLSIVARIVEKMGGSVGVESRGRPGEGSRFWFSLKSAEE